MPRVPCNFLNHLHLIRVKKVDFDSVAIIAIGPRPLPTNHRVTAPHSASGVDWLEYLVQASAFYHDKGTNAPPRTANIPACEPCKHIGRAKLANDVRGGAVRVECA